jgi:hypothetical protein
MTGWEWAEVVAQLVTPIAVLFAIFQLIGARAAKHRDFENLYVQRYWNLMDSFEGDPWSTRSVRALPRRDRSKIRNYLQLCEDELDLRRNGFISTKTWDIWADGMISQCSLPVYVDGMRNAKVDALPALRRFLRNRQDPLKMSPIRKWWTGIGYRRRK